MNIGLLLWVAERFAASRDACLVHQGVGAIRDACVVNEGVGAIRDGCVVNEGDGAIRRDGGWS